MEKEFGEIIINPSTIEDLANEFTDEFAVINEIIANGYDARASYFKIILNKDDKKIIFVDNGIGMSKEIAQKGFLEISNNKREDKEYKSSPRTIMGRKGSGRIGLFGIAKKISIYSKKIGNDPIAFSFDVPAILKNRKIIEEIPYFDDYLDDYKSGTKIVIEDFFISNIFENLKDLNYAIYDNFFPILTDDFNNQNILKMYAEVIIIEENKIKKEFIKPKSDIFQFLDRFMNIKGFTNKESKIKLAEIEKDENSLYGYDPNIEVSKSERIINFEDSDLEISKECKVKTKHNDFKKKKITISKGWIGTLSTIMDSDNEKNYCIKVYSRNRLVIKDIRADFKIDRFYLNYLVGDIFVDDLDDDELKDITKISRNAYGNQDERYKTVVELVKKLAQKLISEKSKIAKKNKNSSDIKTTKTMRDFLNSAQESFSFNEEIFHKFEENAIKKFKFKTYDDKKRIFVSHKSIHEKDNNCLNQNGTNILCFNSFLLGLFLVVIFEKICEIKKKNPEHNSFKIIFTSLPKYSMKLGVNIHQWLRDEGFNARCYENTIFYACISCKYIENWNTDIEYGASWFTKENGTFCLIDPFVKGKDLQSPISSENFLKLIINFSINGENKKVSLENLITNYEIFKKIFIEPLNLIGIDLLKEEYNEIKDDLTNIERNMINYFNQEYEKEIEKLRYLNSEGMNEVSLEEIEASKKK